MVITCEGCSTRFQLDDARVPAQGIRVRCSRCKHAFLAKPPRAAGDPVVRAVNEALHVDDWQCNHESEAPFVGEEPDAARQAVDELPATGDTSPAPVVEGDPEGFSSAGADVDEDIDVRLEDSAPVRDSALQKGGPQTTASELSGLDLAEPQVHERDSDVQIDDAGASVAEVPAVLEEAAASGAADGLGSPENWDFFASDETPADAAHRSQVPLARIALGPPVEALLQIRATAAPDAERPPPMRWLGRAANGAGWTATAGLIALLLQAGGPRLPAGPETHTPVAGLELENFGARSLDNAVVGPIHVVEGTLRVPTHGPVSPGVRLVVQLLDADGAVVADDAATLGPVLSESMLREQSPAELRELLERGAGWSRRPGSTHSVMAVIDAAPTGAERFRVVSVALERTAPPPKEAPAEEDPGA